MAENSNRTDKPGQDRQKIDPGRAKEQGRAGGASRPGVMGDETEEQNLNQPGNPDARISRGEVEEAFRQQGGNPGGKDRTG